MSRPVAAVLWAAAAAALCGSAWGCPGQSGAGQDIPYMRAFGQSYNLDLAGPAGDALLPLAVLVHGGSFTGGTRCAMNNLASDYAERGFRVATISYPLCKDYVDGTDPLLLWDAAEARIAVGAKPPCTDAMPPMAVSSRAVRTAISFLHDNAEQYHIDTSKTVCHGSSAGAYTCIYAQAFNTTATVDMVGSELFGADATLDGVGINVAVAQSGALVDVMIMSQEAVNAMQPGAALFGIVDYKDGHCKNLDTPACTSVQNPWGSNGLPRDDGIGALHNVDACSLAHIASGD